MGCSQKLKSDGNTKGAEISKVKCSYCKRMVDESLCGTMERYPPIHYCAAHDFRGLLTEAELKRRQDNVKVCQRIFKQLNAPRLSKGKELTAKCTHCGRNVERMLMECYAVNDGTGVMVTKYRCIRGESMGLTEAESKRRQDNVKVCRRITKELREKQKVKSVTKTKGAKKLPVNLFRQNIKSDTKMKGAKKLPVPTKVKCSCCKRMVDESFCENVRCPPSYICTAANEDLFLG